MVKTDYHLFNHANSQSSTTGENSKECSAFPRLQSSILNSIAWTPVREKSQNTIVNIHTESHFMPVDTDRSLVNFDQFEEFGW
jgi:hypothetical protein